MQSSIKLRVSSALSILSGLNPLSELESQAIKEQFVETISEHADQVAICYRFIILGEGKQGKGDSGKY